MKSYLLITCIAAISLSSCGEMINDQAIKSMNDVSAAIAKDQIETYNLAVKGGDKIEIYSNAMMVTEAFKQAKDEENYLKWKAITEKHKKEAGIPY